jgi:hypothetical protein
MAPWTIEVKFLHDTQFLFGSLMFTTGEDRNLELLTRGPAPTHRKPVYGEALYYPTNPSASASSDAHSGLNPYEWSYYPSAMTSQGYLTGHLSSSLWLEHRALLLREHSQIEIPSKTTLRSGAALARTLSSTPAASAWWAPPGYLPGPVPANTQ